MKKMFRIIALCGMFFAVLSMVSCSHETPDNTDNGGGTEVDDNNGGNNNGGNNNGGNNGGGNNNGGDNGGGNNNGGNNGGGNNNGGDNGGGNNNGGNNGGSETPSGTGFWSKFEGTDFQIWAATCDLDAKATGLEITVGNKGWWGFGLCNNSALGPSDPHVSYNMTKVAKITLEAKSNKNKGKLKLLQIDDKAKDSNPKLTPFKTDFEKITYDLVNPNSKAFAVFAIAGEGCGQGDVITIRKVAFWDSEGKEIVPTLNPVE
ncbi:hypothetical protein [Treponema sp. Marseille-Q3903]|uniref:hypothetical protein n=1 Tax=Treponema sp. Marseille-Q3903 TaxID=2766703 RepID=UPI00165278DA|nr:hypothetical protein [Treponema sp. Marseille-Q3903]MBC6714509.1 hypothetical protein [Treponema sp. Marseille-Q3903]